MFRAVFMALALVAASAAMAAERAPIIDAHFHTDTGRFFARGFIDGEVIALKPQSRRDMIAESLAVMAEFNIVRAVASGPDPEVVAEWRAAGGGRFVPALQLANARLDRGYLAMIRNLVKEGKLKVLGEIGFQYEGFGPSHPLYDAYYSLAEELDIPVAIHMGPGPREVFDVRPAYRVGLGDPMLLEGALQRHPKLRLHVMHAGWPFLENMIAIMHTYRNVYAGTAFLNWGLPEAEFHNLLRRFVDAGLGKRLMWGSDPVAGAITKTVSMGVERVESASFLSEAQKRDILYNNAARFFRLEEPAE